MKNVNPWITGRGRIWPNQSPLTRCFPCVATTVILQFNLKEGQPINYPNRCCKAGKIYGAVREKHVFYLFIIYYFNGGAVTRPPLYHTRQSDSVKLAVIYRRQDPEGGVGWGGGVKSPSPKLYCQILKGRSGPLRPRLTSLTPRPVRT